MQHDNKEYSFMHADYFYFILCQDTSMGLWEVVVTQHLPPRDSPIVDDLSNVSISSSFDVPNI